MFNFDSLTDAERAEIRRSHEKATTGLLSAKFLVQRTDGRDAAGQPHYGCRYYVLDLDHDRFALEAIEAYALACREHYHMLSFDLQQRAYEMRAGLSDGTWPRPKAVSQEPPKTPPPNQLSLVKETP